MLEELQELGLSENEAKVYYSLLGRGLAGAGDVIKSSMLHPNTVY